MSKYNYISDIINGNVKEIRNKINKVEILKKVVDIEFYNRCVARVKIDIDKLGNEVMTELISNKEELCMVIGFFYYLALVNHFKLSILNSIDGDFANGILIVYDYKSLLSKIYEVTKINKDVIKKYIEYFNMNTVYIGGFNETPLLIYRNDVVFIPSSFIFNDFQFSIVTGHFYKQVKIHTKDKTISQSIVNDIYNHTIKYSNLIIAKEKKYFDNSVLYNGKKVDSDIDIGIYDKISNNILIIECKWKENVYRPHEDFLKIEKAVNEIFREQLGKHKFYLEMSNDNIKSIFDNDQEIDLDNCELKVEYIFIDKRIQYHDENRHVLPIFVLQSLFNKYSKDGKLFLDQVISDIELLRTETSYEELDKYEELHVKGQIVRQNILKLNHNNVSGDLLI